jgi:hypothetical protein
MKMKKTQSLKLMLLGLLTSVSMGAFAGNGDVFTSKNLVLLQDGASNAKVIGVASFSDGGWVIIPDEVQNDFENGKTLKVNGLADDWYAGGEIVLKKDPLPTSPDVPGKEYAGTAVVQNLSKAGNWFKLKIEATQLTNISKDQIWPVSNQIKEFVVASGAGLNKIVEHAFEAKTYEKDDEATEAKAEALRKLIEAEQKKIDDADDLLKGTNGETASSRPVSTMASRFSS